MLLKIVFKFVFLQSVVNSSRILGIFHERSFSHQILGRKLLFELASRGHNVTMLTPSLPEFSATNFTAIKLDSEGVSTGSGPNIFEFFKSWIWNIVIGIGKAELVWTEAVLKDKNFQHLLKSNEQFDLVIMEQLGNHALKGICYHYKAICVILSTMGPTWLSNEQAGNPHNPSFVLDMAVSYPPKMTFYQRLHNTVVQVLQQVYFFTYSIHKHNELLQRYFPGSPHMREILYNVSLVLVNSHFSTSNPASNVPNVVEIGGFHIDPPKPLPPDLETFLNETKDGVIYFSMGSILQVQKMAKNKIDAIVKVLGQLPQKVLWKADSEGLPELPSNILVVKWAPQLDVLAHPNLRLFVTHGGLLSLTEAVSCGVPILGISVFGDQGYNAAFAEASGFGIALPYNALDEKSLRDALNELLNNSSYMINAKRRQRIFHDQPIKPLDRAMYWIEYVIKYKGAPHLRSAALYLRWFQYLLLDVVAVVLLIVFIILIIVRKIFILLVSQKDCFKKRLKRQKSD